VWDALRAAPTRHSTRDLGALISRSLRLLWQADRRSLSILLGTQAMAAVLLAVQLLLVRELLEGFVAAETGDRTDGVIGLVVLLGATLVGLAIANATQKELTILLGERVGRLAADNVLDVAVTVELEAYEQPSFYDQLQRAHFTAASRNLTVARSITTLLGSVLGSAGVAIGVIAVEPRLLPVLVLATLPLWVSVTRNSRSLHRFVHETTSLDRERNYLWSALAHRDFAKEVRSFRVAGYLRARHDALFDEKLQRLARVVRGRLARAAVAGASSAAVTASALLLVVHLVERGALDLARAGTALAGLILLGQRLNSLVSAAGSLVESALFIDDYERFLALRDRIAEEPSTARLDAPFRRLTVEDVTFRYPDQGFDAVSGVSIHVDRGEVVALVGANGSGKTTLATMLAGLHRPTGGRILWDDTDLSDVARPDVRARVTVLFQDFARWSLTASQNIGLGRSERLPDPDGVHAAAERSGALSFLDRLPDGLDTVLGKIFAGSVDLSVGQWQRVAFARALFRDAELLIMDEPTAALDPMAEYELFEAVRTELTGRAVLLISHRFSSVRLADRIYVLDEGRVIEQGTHAELVAAEGRYASMFALQAAAYRDA
jgi:ATP-binding cassette, subfamily B, bacterial